MTLPAVIDRRVPDRTDHTETLPPDIDFALFSSYNLL
jgi:hypothetical protein